MDLSKSDPRSTALTILFEIMARHGETVLGAVRVQNCYECKDQNNQSAQYRIDEHSCEQPLLYHVNRVLRHLASTNRDAIVRQFRDTAKSAEVQAACVQLIAEDIFVVLSGEAGDDFADYWEALRDN